MSIGIVLQSVADLRVDGVHHPEISTAVKYIILKIDAVECMRRPSKVLRRRHWFHRLHAFPILLSIRQGCLRRRF